MPAISFVAGAAEEFDHRRRQLMADAEPPLRDRYLRLGQGRKVGAVCSICVAGAARRGAILDQIDLGDREGWIERPQRHIQRIGRRFRRRAADIAGRAHRALPGPPRIGSVVRRAGLAIENAGGIFAGQRDVALATGIDHRREIVAVVALPPRAHELAVGPEVVGPVFRVIGRVRTEPDLRAAAQMEIDIAQQCDRSRAIPVAGRDDDASAAGAVARRDGGGRGVIVGRAGRGRETGRARRTGGIDERHLDKLALRGAKAGDVELAQFSPSAFGRIAQPGEIVDDELGLLPRITGMARCRPAAAAQQRAASRRPRKQAAAGKSKPSV